MAITNGDCIYYSSFKNNMPEKGKVTIEILKYDFTIEEEISVYKRVDNLNPSDENNNHKDKEFYASSAILSIYFPTENDKNEKVDLNKFVGEEEFLKNTYLSVDFRTKTIKGKDPKK